MRMHLKSPQIRKVMTKKNLLIFLIGLMVVSIIIGIIFFLSLSHDEELLTQKQITSYFNNELLEHSVLLNLKKSLSNNIFLVILIWTLGISVIGIVFILFLFFMQYFTLGFTLSSIFLKFKLKGLLATVFYLIPHKLSSLFLVLYISYHAICFSYNLLLFLFWDREINMHIIIRKYLKNLVIGLIMAIIISIMEVFITPFVLKIFTNLIK